MNTATAILRALDFIGQHEQAVFNYWRRELCDDTGDLRPEVVTEQTLQHLKDEVFTISLLASIRDTTTPGPDR